jgi:hypothetical protein
MRRLYDHRRQAIGRPLIGGKPRQRGAVHDRQDALHRTASAPQRWIVTVAKGSAAPTAQRNRREGNGAAGEPVSTAAPKGRQVCPARFFREFSRMVGSGPLDQRSTENYLRWHSNPGSANRLFGKRDPDDRFNARGVPPCFDSNRG